MVAAVASIPQPFQDVQRSGGWRFDMERVDALKATSTDFMERVSGRFSAPEEIDPRGYHRVENQGQEGSCQGHAVTSVGEHCYHIATGEMIQFSRQFAYIETQRIDGLLGADQGSTIDGGRRYAETVGFCTEDLFPYPNPARYVQQNPNRQKCLDDAATRRIRSHSYLSNYDQDFTYLSAGLGGIEIGVAWGGLIPVNGIVEDFYVGRAGGHALCFLGYSKKIDDKGRKYLWLLNSHSTSWGDNGWAQVAPIAIDKMHRAQGVFIGLSDLSVPKSRPVDWAKNSIYG